MTSCVYALVNTLTGARYIGSTVNFKQRSYAHLVGMRTGFSTLNMVIWKDVREYGPDVFSVEIIEEVEPDDDKLEAAERRWITHYAAIDRSLLYNVDLTGRRPRRREQVA